MEDQNIILFVLATKRIPGIVIKKTDNTCFIEPLNSRIPLQSGGFVEMFFAPARYLSNNVATNDFVTFTWDNPGERGIKGIDISARKNADPIAKDVRAISEEEARNLENEIAISVSQEERRNWIEQCNAQKKELEIYRDEIEKENQIKQDLLISNLSKEREDWIAQTAFQRQEFESGKNWLEKESERINSNRNFLEDKEKKLIRIKQEINCYTSLLTSVVKQDKESDIKPSTIPKSNNLEPEDLGDRWIEMLASKNQILTDSIAIGYLVSTITALCSGSMVLLNGTVGVGKSSIVSKSAELLGGNSEIIPIRPSWLDPSDLLGFFDPLSETFRPSSFTTALKTAAKYPDRPFFICLDELNLAKIENYGADLLSTLEYSKNQPEAEGKKRNLSLYSQDIEMHLWEKLKLLKAEEHLSIEQKLLISQLDRTLSTMPSECEIPQNLILVGTLNSDETTYALSPKVIDRSYVITYPPVNFSSILPKDRINIGEQLSVSQFQDKVNKCIQKIDEKINERMKSSTNNSIEDSASSIPGWEKITQWNKDYISQLGIPLGYRVRRDYKIFFAVSHCLGTTQGNAKKCLAYFLFAKLLPRISFVKDRDKKLENLCLQWIAEIRQDYLIGGESYILEQLEHQIADSGRRNVRYWG